MVRSRPPRDARPSAPPAPPRASRLAVRKRNNRRRSAPLRSRLPGPRQLADACGRALRRAVPAMLALVGVAAVGGGAWWLHQFVTHSPRFAVTRIEIRGTHELDPDAVRARLPFRPGANVFTADLGRAERLLDAQPWIAEAHLRRELPHTIVVDVRERVAAAIVDLDGLYLADADGKVFKRAATEVGEGAGLPVVTGLGRDAYAADPAAAAADIAHALAALDAWRAEAGRPAVAEVHVDRRGLTLYTYDDAIAIRLGDADGDALAARMRTFDRAWAALRPDERARTRAIHVDDHVRPDHVTVAFN